MHLVTGGAGFSGRNILRRRRALRSGHRAGSRTFSLMKLRQTSVRLKTDGRVVQGVTTVFAKINKHSSVVFFFVL